ncbi:hypothetical protein [Micromonospora craniellae]|uniref:hypothetical protein n=1 Tax=Micromonospora craniellae TaxID=2294034 RepID=UPI0037CBE889
MPDGAYALGLRGGQHPVLLGLGGSEHASLIGGGTDAASAEWLPLARLDPGQLAFDHERILADGLERARAKLEYTPLAAAFCPAEFTVAQLRAVYETVWGPSSTRATSIAR